MNSPSLAQLSHGAERLFWRLTVIADDTGRFDANPAVAKSRCFPLLVDRIKTTDVARWLVELSQECIQIYAAAGRVCGVFRNWAKYQRVYGNEPKFPEPPADCGEVPQDPALILNLNPNPNSYVPKKEHSVGQTPNGGSLSRDFLEEAEAVLRFLNDKTGRHYQARERTTHKPTASLELIAARLRAGSTVTECRQVIAKKTRDWTGDVKMNQFLRPSTLFNRKNFEQYCGELHKQPEATHAVS